MVSEQQSTGLNKRFVWLVKYCLKTSFYYVLWCIYMRFDLFFHFFYLHSLPLHTNYCLIRPIFNDHCMGASLAKPFPICVNDKQRSSFLYLLHTAHIVMSCELFVREPMKFIIKKKQETQWNNENNSSSNTTEQIAKRWREKPKRKNNNNNQHSTLIFQIKKLIFITGVNCRTYTQTHSVEFYSSIYVLNAKWCVCLLGPHRFIAIGLWMMRFLQVRVAFLLVVTSPSHLFFPLTHRQ